MNKSRILITGATGKTGRSAIAQLLEMDDPVRALVHRHNDRSTCLVENGVDLVDGDFLDHRRGQGGIRIRVRPKHHRCQIVNMLMTADLTVDDHEPIAVRNIVIAEAE